MDTPVGRTHQGPATEQDHAPIADRLDELQGEGVRDLLGLIHGHRHAGLLYAHLNEISGERRLARYNRPASTDYRIRAEEQRLDDLVAFALEHLARLLSSVDEPF